MKNLSLVVFIILVLVVFIVLVLVISIILALASTRADGLMGIHKNFLNGWGLCSGPLSQREQLSIKISPRNVVVR
jgi:hypothetical protein